MKVRSRIVYGAIFLVGIALVSGMIAFSFVESKKGDRDVRAVNKVHNMNIEVINEKKENKKSVIKNINDIFDGADSIYIKNTNNPTNMVEVNGKDRGFIVANFKGLRKIKSNKEEFKKEIFDLENYSYEINIIEKNIKIKLYSENGFILIEVKDDENYMYMVQEPEMNNFISIVERIYLDKQIEKILYPVPENIYLHAKDESATYITNKKESKELVSRFKILSIVNQQDYIGVPALYPDYEIIIKREDHEYKFHLINKEVMIIDTPIVYLYCKYDREIWNYISKKLVVQNNAKEDELKYLLMADKIIVKDIEGVYDFENSSYYDIEIARCINSMDYKKVDNNKVIDEDLRFSLKFVIDGDIKEVLIYDNYMIYADKKYYSKNISENIKSVLMVP